MRVTIFLNASGIPNFLLIRKFCPTPKDICCACQVHRFGKGKARLGYALFNIGQQTSFFISRKFIVSKTLLIAKSIRDTLQIPRLCLMSLIDGRTCTRPGGQTVFCPPDGPGNGITATGCNSLFGLPNSATKTSTSSLFVNQQPSVKIRIKNDVLKCIVLQLIKLTSMANP